VRDAVRCSARKRIGAVPVVEDGRIVGIISERDVIYCLRDHGAEVLDWPVEPGDELAGDHRRSRHPMLAALATMTQRRIRHLPVVESAARFGDRVDRRPGEAPDGADRGRGRGDARPISRAPEPLQKKNRPDFLERARSPLI
jgi:CBS domain-containing protein